MAQKTKDGSKRGSDSVPPDLKKERDEVLQNFGKGSGLTEEFMQHHERIQSRLRELEAENAGLRAKVEADDAIRELLAKIEKLEREKGDLVSRYRQVEAETTQFSQRFEEIETQFADLANLFVASNQIHSSLSPRGVMRRIKEVLAQLVGAERYAIYLANAEGAELVPIAFEGVPGDQLGPVSAADGVVGRTLKTGAAAIDEEGDSSRGTVDVPSAVVPLRIDDRVVGVIAIFGTLEQKTQFTNVDFELFKLLGQHAAAALVSASLFAQAERKLPGLEAFLDLSV